MGDIGPVQPGRYSHDLLGHSSDDELVECTRAFVEQGLASGGRVLVHGGQDRMAVMQAALGVHPRLEYAVDEADVHSSPSRTLFDHQRTLAERPAADLWCTGPVPIDLGGRVHEGWARYESLVNEALGPFAFHGLCTYDVQALSPEALAVARATHPTAYAAGERVPCPDYVEPAAYLAAAHLDWADRDGTPPTIRATLSHVDDLRPVRALVATTAEAATALSIERVAGFVSAVHEVLVNGLQHGEAPVEIALWAQSSLLTCRVTDAGPGVEPLVGYQHPSLSERQGLWMARQMCEDLAITRQPAGGCRVDLATGDPPSRVWSN